MEPLSFCLSVLSVTLVFRGQMAGWIRLPLGMEVGLGPGDIVLHRDPAAPPQKKNREAQQPSTFGLSNVTKRLDGSRCHLVRR